MSLISVERDKLAVGLRLPWTLYDRDGKVLMERGQAIETEEQLRQLDAAGPLRELTWQPAGNREPAEKARNDDALENALSGASGQFGFQDMRLRVGDRIQLQPPMHVDSERYIVRLLGYLENASLMVTSPASNGMRVPLREHDKIIARVFTSEKAFGFDCAVVRVCKIPFDYLHLSFPTAIQGAVIRKSPRIRTRIIASVIRTDAGGGEEKISGVIANLSADGALVKARQPLADKSEEVILSFRVTLHDMEAYLTTRAVVRNVSTDEDNENDDAFRHQHGVQFTNLPPNDRVILQSLIYQQMIERPDSIA